MTDVSTAQRPVAFDPFAEHLVSSPYLDYSRLRAEAPVCWSAPLGAWVMTRMEDVRAVLNDRTFEAIETARILAEIARRTNRDYETLVGFLDASLFFKNGADHVRDRRTISRIMNRIPLSRVEKAAEDIARDLAAPLAGLARYDAVEAFADPFPQRVMAYILGIPASDVPLLSECLSDLTLIFDPAKLETYDRINAKVIAAFDLLMTRIDEARDDEGSGLKIVLDGAPGEGRERLKRAAATALFTFRVGAETTIGLMGMTIRTLVDQPQLRAALAAEPGLARTVTAELLRLESNVQRSGRVAREPRVIGGQPIAVGERVLLLLGAANRDPADFPDPDAMVLAAGRAEDVAFGAGSHFCLGASLARIEGRIAVETFAALPPLERDGAEAWYSGRTIRRLTRLPVRQAAARRQD